MSASCMLETYFVVGKMDEKGIVKLTKSFILTEEEAILFLNDKIREEGEMVFRLSRELTPCQLV